jgi:cytochrome c-type biogenesis protein CcmF
VLIGTLYPLVIEAITDEKISVGAPFFNMTFVPLMLPLLVIVPFGPLLAWKRGDVFGAAQRLMMAFGASLLTGLATLLFVDRTAVFAALGVALASWLILGALTDLALKAQLGRVPAGTSFRRLAGLPRAMFGAALAHAGLGVSVLGMVATLAFGTEKIEVMKPGSTMEISGKVLRFERLHPATGPNYTEQQGIFSLLDAAGKPRSEIMSGKRNYPVRQMTTTEAGILTLGASQLYVSLGDATNDGGMVVHAWYKPLVTLIWLGGLVMMVGGAVSLSDRRLRVGAPAASRRRTNAESPA